MEVERYGKEEIDKDLLRKAEKLWTEVWPSEDATSDERMQRRLKRMQSQDETYRLHVIWMEGGIVAQCSSFHREIRFLHSDRRVVELALAGVCSAPAHRGKGLGAAVVKDAFARLDEESMAFSLYQTGVPEFYRKLGSRIVKNRFVNSSNQDDPQANPWWNDFVMIQPAGQSWEEGPVDLLGAGY